MLAAASSVFRDIFTSNPVVEDNIYVTLVGYSLQALKAVVEYIYLGTLEFATQDKVCSILMCIVFKPLLCLINFLWCIIQDHIWSILRDFGIQIPAGTDKEFNYVPLLSSPVTPVAPDASQSNRFIPRILSRSVSNKNSSTSPVPQVSQDSSPTAVTNSGALVSTPSSPRQPLRTTENDRPVTFPTVPPAMGKPLNRNVDGLVVAGELHTIDKPRIVTPPGLLKSFTEKTAVFAPVLKTKAHVPQPSVSKTALASYHRQAANAFYDVPGIYTPFRMFHRERFPITFDLPPKVLPEEPLKPSHVNVPSFVGKVTRTYQERPTGRMINRPSERLSFDGIMIDSVHQVRGKVHIRSAGNPIVTKSAESLFEDNAPIPSVSLDENSSRTSFEQ